MAIFWYQMTPDDCVVILIAGGLAPDPRVEKSDIEVSCLGH